MNDTADRWIAAMKARAQRCGRLVHAGGRTVSHGRLGGRPSIARRHEWPTVASRPLSFVAEFDVAALRELSGAEWLPRDGWLHFFYDLVEWAGGIYPSDRAHFAVLFTPGAERPPQAPFPPGLDPSLILPEVPIVGEPGLSYPDPLLLEDELGRMFELPDAEWQRVNDFRDEGVVWPRHQVGGHPAPIQGPDLALDCQLASNGVETGGPEGYASDRARELAAGASDWRLLLQLDSDEAADMMWCDVGTLYFMVRHQDAEAADFSRCWMLLQSS